MDKIFKQKKATIFPDKQGWYDTDKGKLFCFIPGKVWSCRDDRESEEHPNFWYEEQVDEIVWWEYHGKTGKHRKEKWFQYKWGPKGKEQISSSYMRPYIK